MLKKTIIPLIILTVLVVVAFILKSKSLYTPTTPAKAITNFEPDQATRIELSRKDNRITLTYEVGKWVVASSFNYQANQDKVSELLNQTKDLTQSDIASRNPAKHAIFEVDNEKGKLLKILNNQGTTLAHFYIGKMGPDYQSTYVRLHDATEVMLVDKSLGRLVPMDAQSWLDRNLLKFDTKEITQLTLKTNTVTKTEEIILKQDENQAWTITAPETHPCDKSVADDLAQTLSNLQLENVAPITDLAVYGLEEPQRTVIIERKDNQIQTLFIGRTDETGDYYVKSDLSGFVVIVRKNIIQKLAKPLEEFIDRTLTQLDPAQVEELTLFYPDIEIVLKKNETGEWMLETPEAGPAQRETIDFILNTLSNLKANSATREKGLDKILNNLALKIIAKLPEDKIQSLLIGEKKDEQMYYVKKGDSDTVYLLSKHYAENLMKKLDDLKAPPPPPPEEPETPPEETPPPEEKDQ